MKTIFLLILSLFIFNTGQAQVDSVVAKVVEANLKIIGDYLEQKESSLQKISDAVRYFTELTGIPSESEGKYHGQFRPTANDMRAWSMWYELNRDYLFWDQELKSVILYKKVKPEQY